MEIKLPINEIVKLQMELGGSVNMETKEVVTKGILGYTIPLKYRYHFDKILDKTISVVKAHGKVRDEAIFEHRDNKDDTDKEKAFVNPTIEIEEEVDGEMVKKTVENPNSVALVAAFKELSEIEEAIDFPDTITIEGLGNVETNEPMPILFKCFDLVEEAKKNKK